MHWILWNIFGDCQNRKNDKATKNLSIVRFSQGLSKKLLYDDKEHSNRANCYRKYVIYKWA